MTNISTQMEYEFLTRIGLDEKEIKVYLALLKEGAMLPQHIARATGIKRTTLYEMFPEMTHAEVIKEVMQGKRRYFQAVAPNLILRNFEHKYAEIKQGAIDLMALYSLQGLKPNIEIYEGYEGIKRVFKDTLVKNQEILVYNQVSKYDQKMLDWVTNEYVPMRVKNNVCVRAIVTEEEENIMQSGKGTLRKTRYVPKDKFPFKIEGLIYGNKISFCTTEKGGPLVGIVIESKQIADNLRALFDLAWEGAERYQTISKS
jgi:HTH-type transcriptional regulator, sugar sensing transcriptional regulator